MCIHEERDTIVQHQSTKTEAINEQQHLGYHKQLSVYESFKYSNLSCGERGTEMCISLGCLVLPLMQRWSALENEYLQAHAGFFPYLDHFVAVINEFRIYWGQILFI